MKITKSILKRIIKEEYNALLSEAITGGFDLPSEEELKKLPPGVTTTGVFNEQPKTGDWKTGEEFRRATGMNAAGIGGVGKLLGDVGIFKIKDREQPFIATLRKADMGKIVLHIPKTEEHPEEDITLDPSKIESVKPELTKREIRNIAAQMKK